MRTTYRAATGVLLAASIAVAGCSADGSGSAADTAAREAVAPGRTGAAADGASAAKNGDAAEGGAAQGQRRPTDAGRVSASTGATQLIRTATVTVVVKDVPGALAKAHTAADGAGGYVGDETTDRDAEGNERSRVVLRVPPREYDDVLDRLSGLGKLTERQVATKDVTDQVVDAKSRIATQRESVARVRALMDKATSITDIVSLESELSTRQADLESLEAQLKSLQERTSMATITLVLHEPDGEPVPGEEDGPSFWDALAGGWDAFVTAVRWLLVAVGAVLPFALAAGVLYGLWRLLARRVLGLRRDRSARKGRTGTAGGEDEGEAAGAPGAGEAGAPAVAEADVPVGGGAGADPRNGAAAPHRNGDQAR